MATFKDHLEQSQKNLSFLKAINNNIPDCYDWQVTTCFYVAVHLMNAYIVDKTGFHYRSHEDVNNALNSETLSAARLSQGNFLAYRKLQGLARRSRYLCNQDYADKSTIAHFTYDKHVFKSVKKLDQLIIFFVAVYPSTKFEKIKLNCPDFKAGKLNFFSV